MCIKNYGKFRVKGAHFKLFLFMISGGTWIVAHREDVILPCFQLYHWIRATRANDRHQVQRDQVIRLPDESRPPVRIAPRRPNLPIRYQVRVPMPSGTRPLQNYMTMEAGSQYSDFQSQVI